MPKQYKCPLKFGMADSDCIFEKCEWYIDVKDSTYDPGCSIRVIAKALEDISMGVHKTEENIKELKDAVDRIEV